MKKIVCFIFLFTSLCSFAQVGIGVSTVNMDASAQLDISSTTKGLLAPRMTAVQKNAIVTPAIGLLIYQMDATAGFYYFDGSVWKSGIGVQGEIGATGPAGLDASITAGSISGSSTANGISITTGVVSLAPADESNGGVVTTGAQTFAGTKYFSSDIKVNGVTIGKGSNNYPIGNNNTAIGTSALLNNTTGVNNLATGGSTLFSNTTGTSNTALGTSALFNNSTGYFNTASGQAALIGNTTGNYNTGIGKEALLTNTTGLYNTAIGYKADVGSAALENATAIGNGAKVVTSNSIQLGNTSVTNVNTSGTVTAASVTLSSDLRLKRNITPLKNSIDTVMQLNPVRYEKKNSLDSVDYSIIENGFIAQELQKIIPTLVVEGTDKDKLLSVNYTALIPVLTRAIQEQQRQLEEQQKQIEELREFVSQLINKK